MYKLMSYQHQNQNKQNNKLKKQTKVKLRSDIIMTFLFLEVTIFRRVMEKGEILEENRKVKG